MRCVCGCGELVPHAGRYLETACRVRAYRRRQRHVIKPLPQAVLERAGVSAGEAVTQVLTVTDVPGVTGPAAVTGSAGVTRARPVTAAGAVAVRSSVTGARVAPVELERDAHFGFADPVYPGCAYLYREQPYCCEVNHPILVGSLCATYPDGWALCTGSRSLQDVLAMCPAGVRVGIWHRPGPGRRNARPRTWEAVIICGGRWRRDTQVPDHLECGAPVVPGFHGAKPLAFSVWVFALLGARATDVLDDLFPGSGAVSRAWQRYALEAVTPSTG